MKDVSISSAKQSRPLAYPKKRPSPDGITKSRKQSPLHPSGAIRRTPFAAKAELLQQRQRHAQILALRRQGVLLEEEYRDEVQYYMHEMERYTMSSASCMDQQPEIKWHMRPCLVDFLVEVHFTFRLRPETLYLTLNIIDRYVSRRIVYIKHYQLVGCAALWIASKFEDAKERVPTVRHLASVCRETYDESAFIQMEGHVLTTIQWMLGHPTAEAWLRLLCCGTGIEEQKVQHVARFLMEITLFYREFVKFLPSSIARGSLTLARFVCGCPRVAYDETEECLEVVDLLDARLAKHINDLSEMLVKKYSYAFYSKAATFTVQYYLQGGRFVRQPFLTLLPVTPVRTPLSSLSTPMSVMSTSSDMSSDDIMMPVTPPSGPFIGQYMESDKENMPTTFSPVINNKHMEVPPDQYLPHDFVTFGRPALHDHNVSSPLRAIS